MNENMRIWEQCDLPPNEALKTITVGRMNGKSDINPQWRIKKLTEMFGVCGIGWYYDIEKLWNESGANGELMSFAKVNLFIKIDNEWSKPIQGTGGHMLIVSEYKGIRSNDEAYKMAITDALSVCCKMLGIASRVYEGTHADSKYDRKSEVNVVSAQDVASTKEIILKTKTVKDLESIGRGMKLSTYSERDLVELREVYSKKLTELKAVENAG